MDLSSSTISLLICIITSLVFATIAVLFLFLYKKLNCRNGQCCSIASVETPSDINRLTSSPSISTFEYDGTDESGYVGGHSNSSVDASILNIQSCSPLSSTSRQVPSLSRSASFCSFFSIDETIATNATASKSVKFVSREVQTEPVAIVSVDNGSSKITETISFGNVSPICTTTEQPDLDDDDENVCTHETNQYSGNSELSSGEPTNQPLFHFENFGELAEFVLERQQLCPSESVRRTNRDSLPVASSVKEPLSSSSTTVAPSQPSSSTKRKWRDEEEDTTKRQNFQVHPSVKKDNILGELTTTLNDKSLFVSETERILKQQQMSLEKLIEKGHIWDTPRLKEIVSALEWIEILRQTLLGKRDVFETQSSSLTEYELQQCIRFLQDLQKSSLVRAEKLISLTQKLLLFCTPPRDYYYTLPSGGNDKNVLVIGVDATPYHFGGYCVDLAKKCIEFYVINVEDLPWEILNKFRPDEFEMKNFILALCIWHRAIEESKLFSVYTDNSAIIVASNKYGSAVEKLMQHFVGCKGAKLCNNYSYVNRMKDLASFAAYIQPADDLSRLQIAKCMDFLCEFYSIQVKNVRGTHQFLATKRAYSRETKTLFYNQALKTAREFIHSLECSKCFGLNSVSSPLFQDLKKINTSTSRSTLSLSGNTESSMQIKPKGRKRKRKKSKVKVKDNGFCSNT